MYKRLLVGGLILTLLVTGCVQSPTEIPTHTPASEARETPTLVPDTTTGSITTTPTTPTANAQQNEPTTFPPKDYVPAGPDPEFDNFTWTLPTGASPLRLSLPAEIEDIFYSEKTGVGGFGLHAGGHIEGLDHVWIELKPGTPVRSWADGVVEDVRLSGMVDQREYHITINYGQNLIGIHMEIETPYVKKGDQVNRGQEVGLGMSFDSEQSSAEFAFIDLGRTDGVKYYGGKGVFVSPYDYLDDSEKKKLVAAYKKYVIEPYQRNGSREGVFSMFEPYQPYLTNKLFLHQGNEGRLSGTWYLFSSKWYQNYPNDILTFIEADNPYYKGNVVLASDDRDEGSLTDWSLKGTFEVNYEEGRVTLVHYDGTTYFGIFEIDESEGRAKLKIEYQKGSYPAGFSSKAITYIERSNLSRRNDGYLLGVRDSPY